VVYHGISSKGTINIFDDGDRILVLLGG